MWLLPLLSRFTPQISQFCDIFVGSKFMQIQTPSHVSLLALYVHSFPCGFLTILHDLVTSCSIASRNDHL